ncbi:MAG TPA: septation protein A [Gammaproteobacteria bacterium]|jgi:intracellular septation protein|nr:septation protein A [Acidiferrobacteraceae bacterium]MDP6398815.1 septation protein A [Arenicellales bacterium]MDP6551205.1 septation protein A [Arenicellales bacterium]MDP6919005.1 septation protein A [Arenicellales bacterium]HCX88356.1 septation protein A [Gammaproteobacteria bacterium]|tara:strand:+ start:1067 stop:1633 length:567 start_codon:yes stop_codon:yes gene_type:complete
MKLLFDFFPLVLFFGTYKLYDIFAATLVAMAASLAQVVFVRVRHQRFETTHLVTLFVILLFGGMTLLFRDDVFIKWKPTIVNWIFAVIVLGSQFIGKQTVLQRLLGSQMQMPASIWKKVNVSWGLFFFISGLLNLYVAFYFRTHLDEQIRTDFWVNFKVFGLLGLTLAFSIVQMMMVARHISTKPPES